MRLGVNLPGPFSASFDGGGAFLVISVWIAAALSFGIVSGLHGLYEIKQKHEAAIKADQKQAEWCLENPLELPCRIYEARIDEECATAGAQTFTGSGQLAECKLGPDDVTGELHLEWRLVLPA